MNLNNKEWTSIGTDSNSFQGTFDGQNNIITNLKITKEIVNSAENKHQGLFGYISGATIENLNIAYSNVQGGVRVAIFAGTVANQSTINNINIYNSTLKSYSSTGGVIGRIETNSTANYLNVYDSTLENSYLYFGGVIGYINTATLKNLYTNSIIISTSNFNLSSVGGVVGGCFKECDLEFLYSDAQIRGNSDVGGIIGQLQNGSKLKNSISNAEITAINNVGGAIGTLSAYNGDLEVDNIKVNADIITTNGQYIGGAFGYLAGGTITISNILTNGKVKGNDMVGGIAGQIIDTTLNYKNCISNVKITANSNYKDLFGHVESTSVLNRIEN